ncbi:Dbl homology domain-containing protein [Helicostylum pulchrum]|nr:Dbl homology domain-containing protein [Helicostylum pulchrum]
MDEIEKKLELLQIDTQLVPKARPKSLTMDKTKRRSTSLLLDTCPYNSSKSIGHKRSVSFGSETIFLPRNQSVPNLLSKATDAKNSIKSRKKWFQLSRLKRQASTPPKRDYGGLKAGLVEPPEPPPQLLFNLDWSSNKLQPLECDNNTLLSTDFRSDPDTPQESPIVVRRGSCPVYKPTPPPAKTDSPPPSPTHKSKLTSASSSSSSTASTPSTPLDDHQLFDVYEPNTNQIVLRFSQIKSRNTRLKRKSKNEARTLHIWQNELLYTLNDLKITLPKLHSFEKTEKYSLTRKFILREFYTTEINFWNQLNYTKVMFSDPLHLAVDRNSDVTKTSDMNLFANLHDLMKFSYTLIVRLRNAQIKSADGTDICKDVVVDPMCLSCPNDVNIGYVLCDMAESMVTFLRCAVDYSMNKKTLDQRLHNKAYALYNEKLALRKETRQFTLHDYLIIPIQRITRYGLLLADLEKHTESTHPDYYHIRVARCIVQSLAAAMNAAQKK